MKELLLTMTLAETIHIVCRFNPICEFESRPHRRTRQLLKQSSHKVQMSPRMLLYYAALWDKTLYYRILINCFEPFRTRVDPKIKIVHLPNNGLEVFSLRVNLFVKKMPSRWGTNTFTWLKMDTTCNSNCLTNGPHVTCCFWSSSPHH